MSMKIVGFDIVNDLLAREKRARPQRFQALDRSMAAWRQEVKNARWSKPMDVKAVYGSADVVGNNRVVFNICGNHY